MAKGSHSTYGGWEPRTCYHCGRRLTLARDHAWHHYDDRTGWVATFCDKHENPYTEAYADMMLDPDTDNADRIHPDQLTLEQ